MISFNVRLNHVIRTLFLHNDIVSSMHDLPISGNKKKYTILRILDKNYTILKNLPSTNTCLAKLILF